MRRSGLFGIVLACSLALQAKTLYLVPNANWKKDGARFAVYAFDNGDAWFSMSAVSGKDGMYQADVDDKYPKVIFCRMNPSTPENNFNDGVRWNQTADLSVPPDKNLYTVTEGTWDKGGGEWSSYGQGGDTPGGGDTPDPVTPSDYATAVPSQCEDIMLQAFYWDSDQDKGYGNTKWQTLTAQAAEISRYFSMVWLPPSSAPTPLGIYITANYSTQSSTKFGKRTYLDALINELHNNGIRIIADIVINHSGNKSNACDFDKLNFGSYGTFEPDKNWITSDDSGGCGSSGNPDDGQHDADYGPARDWDHKNKQVQNMCKAYLQWMKNEIHYDGWRYDYAGGFHVSHINDYNVASKPYFSVMEYWYGDANVLKTRIDEADKNTLAFDFAAKYDVFRDGIYKANYTKCSNGGLRGKGYSKYAVTFIDNHDTFNRGTQGEDVAEKRDGSSINDKSLMMRCNAYLLSMPGVPCVFWPHWVKYKSDIQQMIIARKRAGIHSESTVTEEAQDKAYYRATIQGKYGSVKLMLGTAANDAAPSGYTLAVKGSDYAMYYTGDGKQAVENVQRDNVQGTKFIRDGQLFIRCGEKVYDAQGRLAK